MTSEHFSKPLQNIYTYIFIYRNKDMKMLTIIFLAYKNADL